MKSSQFLRCSSERPAIEADFFDFAREIRESAITSLQSSERLLSLFETVNRARYYTASAADVLGAPMQLALIRSLRAWGLLNLGCAVVQEPAFSVYSDGCFQGWHQDTPAGPWSYVYSLTDWSETSFRGGVTKLMGNGPDASPRAAISPLFNQLLVFDAQWPHCVERVFEVRKAADSRIVLHGMFGYPRLVISRDLNWSQDSVACANVKLLDCEERVGQTAVQAELLTARLRVAPQGNTLSVTWLARCTFGVPAFDDRGLEAAERLLAEVVWPSSEHGGAIIVPLTLRPEKAHEPSSKNGRISR